MLIYFLNTVGKFHDLFCTLELVSCLIFLSSSTSQPSSSNKSLDSVSQFDKVTILAALYILE